MKTKTHKTQIKQQENKANKIQQKNTWKHKNINTSGNTTKDQTTNRDCDEGGGMAGGVDSPGEEVVGAGYCPKRGGHALARGAHVPAYVVQAADREVFMES